MGHNNNLEPISQADRRRFNPLASDADIRKTLDRERASGSRQRQLDAAAAAKAAEAKGRADASMARQDALKKEGADLSQSIFGEGKLGRLDAKASVDAADIRARRRSALDGLSAEENQALREKTLQNLQTTTQGTLRQLRGAQAASGVRGGAGIAQQAGVLNQAAQTKAGLERDLLLGDVALRNKALADFEGTVGDQEAVQRKAQKFNIEQKNREAFGRLSTTLGFGARADAERSGARTEGLSKELGDLLRETANKR